jgi:hypothetical protein
MSRLQLPGQVSVSPQIIDGPNATPVPFTIQNGSNQYEVLILGGLSKMEHIMALLLSRTSLISPTVCHGATEDVAVRRAADIAEQIIAEAAKRAKALPQRNGDGMI